MTETLKFCLLLSLFSQYLVIIRSLPVPGSNPSREWVEQYLLQYGHAIWPEDRRPTDSEYSLSIMQFQQFFKLEMTGILDQPTLDLMTKTRCDVPDLGRARERYELYSDYEWTQNLRWKLNQTHPSVPISVAEQVIGESVQEWLNWMDTITITKSDASDSEIIVNFAVPDAYGVHGADTDFPFSATTLAHAFFPFPPFLDSLGGDLHYNMAQQLSADQPTPQGSYSLKFVTVHELGHSLGIKHSQIEGAIMYPYLGQGISYDGLKTDDIQAIQQLFGHCRNNPTPCQNGGTCTHNAGPTKYTCACVPPYTGDNCEIDSSVCDSAPCQNSGVCTSTGSSTYSCQCNNNYTGTNCETALPCASAPCQNNGVCTNSGGSYTCQCGNDYTGTNCETALPCASAPCQNNGACTNSGGSYTCRCVNDYTGTNCETAPPCASTPCQNQGVCSNVDANTYSCQCVNYYTGTNCETAPPCASSPCQNGGTCTNTGGSGYSCQCVSNHYTGTNCETELPCASSPCHNGGTCTNIGDSGFKCDCMQDQYEGTQCDNAIFISGARNIYQSPLHIFFGMGLTLLLL